MSKPVFLRLAANQVMADIWAAQLKEAGYPADTRQPVYPYPHAGAPVEIWLLDGDILEMPGVRQRIDELIGPIDPEDLPEEFTAEEPPDPPGKLRMWHVLAAAFLLLALWVVGCGRTPDPAFDFMKGAMQNAIDAETSRWVNDLRMHAQLFYSKKPYEESMAQARTELKKRGYDLQQDGEAVSFWKEEENSYIRRPVEMVVLYPDPTAPNGKGTVILWAYRPSNAQRIGRALGL